MSVSQLSKLLPLPDNELQQVLDYATTLSKPEAAEHLNNLLGSSPLAVEFISSFNSRRHTGPSFSAAAAAATPSTSDTGAIEAVPKPKRAPKKKKAAIHTPQARQVDGYSAPAGSTYNKKDQDLDYIPQRPSAPSSADVSRSTTPKPVPKPAAKPPPKQHASAGYLIADGPSKPKPKSNPGSRSSTPKPSSSTTKISISGGLSMAGASTAIADLDAAIRALEISTNPSLDNPKARKCNCVATRHPLQGAAPNCLSCGKVICMKEGLGPCTFCGSPLLSPDDVQAMVRELKDERGRERMAADRQANRRADVAKTPAAFTTPRGNDGPSLSDAEAKARAHRDKLLNFQAENAQRTTVRDEAADFDVSGALTGTGSMWSTPEERARELKRQQKILREMEWNARPDYEKRKQVLSIDLVGGKVVRKMAAVERPATPEEDEEVDYGVLRATSGNRNVVGGAFSGNPLLGSLIRPVFDAKGKGAETEGRESRKKKGWQRVQHDLKDNENLILDGGVRGHAGKAGDEPECG
ncbi:putative zinc finger motif, C2HC5-type-domain-containing protein [Dactylonectria estremocensis]|uniref:Zinc finger motif, C2HC5-type-domain-containing protein n=1 Tax=Dactylonectria estremocensis TaxID=1079267 RepID=A0A9P9JLS6_9HYPO|nr:putative zinc finger motif, C2HC5-type-domain-containing protein [Dactylonectria estremocensis]